MYRVLWLRYLSWRRRRGGVGRYATPVLCKRWPWSQRRGGNVQSLSTFGQFLRHGFTLHRYLDSQLISWAIITKDKADRKLFQGIQDSLESVMQLTVTSRETQRLKTVKYAQQQKDLTLCLGIEPSAGARCTKLVA